MAIDLKTIDDDELEHLQDNALREISRRYNEKEAPLRKADMDSAIAASAKLSLAGVKAEADAVDGDWVVIDVTAVDDGPATQFISDVLSCGAKFVSATKVRHHAKEFTKADGHFEKLEALL